MKNQDLTKLPHNEFLKILAQMLDYHNSILFSIPEKQTTEEIISDNVFMIKIITHILKGYERTIN